MLGSDYEVLMHYLVLTHLTKTKFKTEKLMSPVLEFGLSNKKDRTCCLSNILKEKFTESNADQSGNESSAKTHFITYQNISRKEVRNCTQKL